METQPDQIDVADVVARLRADRNAASRDERLALARGLAEHPAAYFQTLEAAALLSVLADDPLPQVRQAVAWALEHLPEPLFATLHEKLEHDHNAFVLNAVERAVARRARAVRAAQRTRFGVDQVAAHLQRIEKRHGAPAARDASRLCERYTQLLVASMVHDLRSVLTHLKANTLALLAETSPPAGARRARLPARVRDDLEFLERTVLDMEQFTEPLDAGRRPERLVDLLRAAQEIAVASVRANGEVDPSTIAADLDIPEHITVVVARHQVVTALANILKNAFEAFAGGWPRRTQAVAGDAGDAGAITDEVGRIEITARRVGDHADLCIRDNGMGFAQEEADTLHLFTPGRRNKTKRNSTGYGLPNAARKIVSQGGSIHFDSQEGRGTVVTVRLPTPSKGREA
ncbi:MAG: HAMP domain-containing histidine kinase [Phycisphaerae bacterium]|nr:HAMP domain-containing histidine kinase [Phycisphaerae bacterium]